MHYQSLVWIKTGLWNVLDLSNDEETGTENAMTTTPWEEVVTPVDFPEAEGVRWALHIFYPLWAILPWNVAQYSTQPAAKVLCSLNPASPSQPYFILAPQAKGT